VPEDIGPEGDYLRGAEVIGSVLSVPLFRVAANAGFDGQAVIDRVRKMPDGYGLSAPGAIVAPGSATWRRAGAAPVACVGRRPSRGDVMGWRPRRGPMT
jgi:hypothetical protein